MTLLAMNPDPWLPHNDRHLVAVRAVSKLAPRLSAAMSQNDTIEIAACTTAVWKALEAAARSYDYAPEDVDVDPAEARRLLAVYDVVWTWMNMLALLSKLPIHTRKEPKYVTQRRALWGGRAMYYHKKLNTLLKP